MKNIWKLSYGGKTLEFGHVSKGIFHTRKPQVQGFDIETDDVKAERRDGDLFGEDFLGGQTISFSLGMQAADRAAVEDLRERLATFWRADPIRRTPGAVAELYAPSGRIAYGRPREFSTIDTMVDSGLMEAVADFRNGQTAWYGAQSPISVPFAPLPSGGLRLPMRAPMQLRGSTDKESVLDITGTLATPIWIQIKGPISNPVLEVPGVFKVRYPKSLAYDEVLTIDARPWRQSVSINGRAAVLSTDSTWLSELLIDPGEYVLRFGGVSESSTASATVTHRPAYPTY